MFLPTLKTVKKSILIKKKIINIYSANNLLKKKIMRHHFSSKEKQTHYLYL